MVAYRLSNNSPQTSLKQRVQVDDITVGVRDIGPEHIINSTMKAFTMSMPVLHVTLNNEICHANLDTGAQINMMTESLFKHIGKINKLPLYPKSDVKLVGYGNRNIEYIGTTVVDVTHTKKATFYVTRLNDNKMILGLCLCIILQLLFIHCDDKCQCKSHELHETKKIGSEFPIGLDLQQTQQDVLPPVPISTKLEGDDVKQQIMDLYPDLFSGVGTIKNAMVHLDVKPGAVPVVCSRRHVPHAVQPKLKEELDRMLKLGFIRKLDINEASDWVHTLVIVIKPNGKLHVCLDPRTLNSILQHNVHNAKRFIDIISKFKGFKYVSKIDTDSGFWTLPLDPSS